MTAKRESRVGRSPTRPKTKAKPKAPSTALTESAVLVILEAAEPSANRAPALPSDLRRQLIAAEAYFRAERRGFEPGHELEDWVAAESAVDSQLGSTAAA